MIFVGNRMNTKTVVAIAFSGSLVGCSVSLEYDKSIGEQNSQVVAAQMGLYQKHQLDSYVDNVGQKLVAHLDEPEFTFSFHIVDDTTPNAFALPGGYIYISRGLLALMNNEDELACVLAHEIIHVTERHSVQQMKRSILPSLSQVPGNIVGSVISEDLGALINAPIAISSGLFMASYSRGHETQSDELGVKLAVKAGYNPYSMGLILTRLNTAVEFTTQQETQKSYFDSHPYTPERVEHVNLWAAQFTNQYAPATDDRFVRRLNGLLIGNNPDKGVFVGDDFLHPLLGFSMQFPSEWQKVNLPNVVAAGNESQTGMIALTRVSADYNAEQMSQQFSSYMQQHFDYKVDISQYENEWGSDTYHAQIRDSKGGKPVYLDQYWLDVEDATYQLMSVTSADTVVLASESAFSFKPISQQQRDAIYQRELKVVTVQKGEDVAKLLERSNSPMRNRGVEILNGLESANDLSEGDALKVIVKAPYTSNQ